MTTIILSGCNGKMGRVITDLVGKKEQLEIVAGIDLNTESPAGFPVVQSPDQLPCKGDVIIDFSHPSCFEGLLSYALENNTPVVFATTGLSKEQRAQMEHAANTLPIFFSANMSLGVNVLIDAAVKMAKILEDNFDIEIVEKHHNQKIDAPSGTALAIADAISDNLSAPYEYVYDRHSVRKKRDKREIGIHAVRGGTIVGEHSVIFAGQDEVLEIKHQATSKEIFAVGAVQAAQFLVAQKPGLYNMTDLVASF